MRNKKARTPQILILHLVIRTLDFKRNIKILSKILYHCFLVMPYLSKEVFLRPMKPYNTHQLSSILDNITLERLRWYYGIKNQNEVIFMVAC
jgi:hypothetical protein